MWGNSIAVLNSRLKKDAGSSVLPMVRTECAQRTKWFDIYSRMWTWVREVSKQTAIRVSETETAIPCLSKNACRAPVGSVAIFTSWKGILPHQLGRQRWEAGLINCWVALAYFGLKRWMKGVANVSLLRQLETWDPFGCHAVHSARRRRKWTKLRPASAASTGRTLKMFGICSE